MRAVRALPVDTRVELIASALTRSRVHDNFVSHAKHFGRRAAPAHTSAIISLNYRKHLSKWKISAKTKRDLFWQRRRLSSSTTLLLNAKDKFNLDSIETTAERREHSASIDARDAG